MLGTARSPHRSPEDLLPVFEDIILSTTSREQLSFKKSWKFRSELCRTEQASAIEPVADSLVTGESVLVSYSGTKAIHQWQLQGWCRHD